MLTPYPPCHIYASISISYCLVIFAVNAITLLDTLIVAAVIFTLAHDIVILLYCHINYHIYIYYRNIILSYYIIIVAIWLLLLLILVVIFSFMVIDLVDL